MTVAEYKELLQGYIDDMAPSTQRMLMEKLDEMIISLVAKPKKKPRRI